MESFIFRSVLRVELFTGECEVNKLIFKLIKPLLKRKSIDFLKDSNWVSKNKQGLEKKLVRQSTTGIGEKLDITPDTSINEVPLTGYPFYEKFYESPKEGDLIYPLKDYVRSQTSGTMGKPKTYLLPRTGIKENIRNTGPSLFMIGTYDGKRTSLEADDVIYTNTPEGSFFTGHVKKAHGDSGPSLGKVVPPDPDELSFQEKVDYFIDNYKDIDIAYMTVTTLIDEVYPKIREPFKLKAFFTQDLSAAPLKEKIKEITGGYPKTVFGSTESMMSNLPSLEHPGGFLFDWRVIYPEFIPEKQRVDTNINTFEASEILSLDEVEVGKRYQFIATPFFNDMTRYVMPDIFECIDNGDDIIGCETPIFKYFSRSDRLMVLHNFTRINEEELLQALVDAGLPFVDFTAQRELEGSREYMHLYIELQEDIPESELIETIDLELRKMDKDWRDLVAFLKYEPIKITKLARGTVKRYLQNKEGVPRLTRIGMRKERLEELLNHEETG